jgi:riboflavin synthase
MFTGLIETVGKVRSVDAAAASRRITIVTPQIAAQLKEGDSVAMNGVCLTALGITPDSFSADLAQETVQRTSLARLSPGTPVNLELPTRAGTPLGGHVVQGHIDGVGRVRSLERILGAEDWRLEVELPSGLDRYLVRQGSIAIEGISLTIADIEENLVSIAIIPHTYQATNLHALTAGDPVNIEVDVLAKYAEKMRDSERDTTITTERLLAEGF